MPERKYSVAEIDRMRAVISTLLAEREPVRSGNIDAFILHPADPARVEDQLRTYMLNGTEPEELERELSDGKRLSDRRE